jgi:hypothetical protein
MATTSKGKVRAKPRLRIAMNETPTLREKPDMSHSQCTNNSLLRQLLERSKHCFKTFVLRGFIRLFLQNESRAFNLRTHCEENIEIHRMDNATKRR